MFRQLPLLISLWCLVSMTELSMIITAGDSICVCICILYFVSEISFIFCSRRVVGVSEIILHPNYNPANNPNDLALLKLAEKVDPVYFVFVICHMYCGGPCLTQKVFSD